MSVNQKKKTQPPAASVIQAVNGSDGAPVVFFDAVVCYGVANGIVALELINRCLVPGEKGVRQRTVVTAHLRCSLVAAQDLAACLDKALALAPASIQPKNESLDIA